MEPLKKIPEDPKDFNKLMLSIDQQLSIESFKIFQRPAHACRIISKDFGISLLMTSPRPGIPKELAASWGITQRIYKWYDQRYGDRLKVNPSPGRMAFLIDNDVWIFTFPRIFGTVHFIASHTIKSNKMGKKGKPLIHNILDSIIGLPDGLRSSLTEKQLNSFLKYFVLGYDVLSGLESYYKDCLISSAMADIDASIDHMISRDPEYGLSKWSSLQATEKVIKYAINKVQGEFSKTHNLMHLEKEAQKCGMKINISELITKIQCTPEIRYGQEKCTVIQAIDAHHAMFKILLQVLQNK